MTCCNIEPRAFWGRKVGNNPSLKGTQKRDIGYECISSAILPRGSVVSSASLTCCHLALDWPPCIPRIPCVPTSSPSPQPATSQPQPSTLNLPLAILI
eukprot:6479410-Amphidinium_carterae.1